MFNNDYTNYSDKIMKKRKIYEKPAMQVFELKQQPQLLAGSGGEIPNNDPYTPEPDPFSF